MILLKTIGSLFFSFALPRIKNTKTVRDFQDKWVRDNYKQKVKLMFEAAISDAKASVELPDELIHELLNNKSNREEIFRWIIEGVPYERFNAEKLSLEPYFEGYPNYQDLIVPFFKVILLKIDEYKQKHWDPEFLQLLNRSFVLENAFKEGFQKIEAGQLETLQIIEENNLILKNTLSPVEYKDLNELIKAGKVTSAREKAIERLNRGLVNPKQALELQAIIAASYFTSGQEKEAIPHLYNAIGLTTDEARKRRLETLVKVFEENLDQAISSIQEAIRIEGYSERNLEILVNVYLQQKDYESALNVFKEHPNNELETLKANVLLAAKKFNELFEITEQKLSNNPDDIDWLLIQADSIVLKQEQDFSDNIIIDPSRTLEEVMPILNQIEKQNVENRRYLIRVKELKAALYMRNKNYSEAKMLYEELYEQRDGKNLIYFNNLIYTSLLDKSWDKAIQLLEKRISGENEPDINDVIHLANFYIEAGKPEDAVKLLEDNSSLITIEEKLPLHFYFAYIDALFLCSNYIEIKKNIANIESKTSDKTGVSALYGYYSTLIHDWDTVITKWESCINQLESQLAIECKIQLSLAYDKKGTRENYKKIKEIIPTIPNWFQHDFLINRYVKALYKLDEYEEIISLFNSNIPSKSTFFLEVVTTIYFHLEWYEHASINFMTLYKHTKQIDYLLKYAGCLYRLGNINECLNILTSAENRVNESGTIEDFNLLSYAFMNAMEYRKALEYAYKTLLVGKENPDVWRFYFSQFTQLQQFVENPDQSWINEYQNIFQEFNEKFPDEEPVVRQVKALEEDGSISEEMITELKKSSHYYQDVKEFFQSNRMPVSFLIAAMNKGPYETWSHVANENDLYTWVQKGASNEINEGLQMVKGSEKVLCDITTLLTIRHIGLLDKFKQRYKLYIHQDHFNRVYEEYTKTKLVSEKGLTTLSYENNGIAMQEVSADEAKKWLKKQEEFIKWINEHCEKVGKTITNNSNLSQDETISIFADPLEASKNNSSTFLIDNFRIRDYAIQYHSVNCINTVDLLSYFLTEGMITEDEYNHKFGELMLIGYSLLTVPEGVFTYYIYKNDFKINHEIKLLFQYLKQEEFNHDFLIELGVKILRWIWLEQMAPFERQRLTDHLCETLTFRKNKADIVNELIRKSELAFSPLVIHQWEEMRKCMKQWLKSQIIFY